MSLTTRIVSLLGVLILSACVGADSGDVLRTSQAPQTPQTPQIAQAPAPQNNQVSEITPRSRAVPAGFGEPTAAFATDQSTTEPIFRPRNQVTHLINGLASSVGSIGYGFTNLSKKIKGSKLHNYATFVESSTLIRSQITKELKAAYRADPNVEINMIGISFGANIVTLIAADLDRLNIPVNYIVTMEGPAMVPIRDNVRIADNFSCTNLDCFRTKSRLSWGNTKTQYSSFKIKASHIPLANHPKVHQRILSQLRTRPPQNFASQ